MYKIKNIALIPNLTKKGAFEASMKTIGILRRNGMNIFMRSDLRESYKEDGIIFYDTTDKIIESADIVLTIGGDGTIIHAARHAAPLHKPLLGINMGRLGYVAGLA